MLTCFCFSVCFLCRLKCLIGGGNDKAKRYLKRLVELDPENGFGLGHLGFVYKLELKYEKAVPLMFAGLRGNDDRSRESRFYYHLGDALQRLNRSEEVRTSKTYNICREELLAIVNNWCIMFSALVGSISQ